MINVYNMEIYKNKLCPNGCIRIFWEGECGFGQYDLIIQTYSEEEFAPPEYRLKIIGDSEFMDLGEDKRFLKSLFESLLEHVEVIG